MAKELTHRPATWALATVWLLVVGGGVASLAQILLDWRFDTTIEKVVHDRAMADVRAGRTDAVMLWDAWPHEYYLGRLVLWALVFAAAVVGAWLFSRQSPHPPRRNRGQVALAVLGGSFALGNLVHGGLYAVGALWQMKRFESELFGDDSASADVVTSSGMLLASIAVTELLVMIAAAMAIVAITVPRGRDDRQDAKLGPREGE